MKRFNKIFTSLVMVMTVFVMSGFTMLVNPSPTLAAAQAGDLIKKDGLSAVYYLGDDGKRYVFPNESTFKSWYSDFSSVVTVSADELASYPLGANVVVRPGTKLVKITTDPKVYVVEPNGALRWIQTEADAIALYGANWASRVIDVADSFFTNYTIEAPLASNEVPVGSLVQKAGEGHIYYYDGSDYRLIEDEVAFLANKFQFANILTLNNFTPSGATITGAETAIVKTSQSGAVGPVVTGSGVTVALNSMTPASKNIPAGSSVEFLKFNLTAANDGPVNVNSLTLTSIGLSEGKNIKDVTIYDGRVKVGSSKNINSDREATFNFSTPINVAAGSTKTLTVKATVSDYGSYGLSIAAASNIVSTGATVSGSFPIQGNLMSPTENTSVGSVTVDGKGGDTFSATFGEDDVLLAQFDLDVDTEDALLESLRLYNKGTRGDSIIFSPVLYIDGEKVAEGTYTDRYVSFDLNYKVEKSDSVSVEVRADIGIADVDNEIELSLKDNNDILAVGMIHGFTLEIKGTDPVVGNKITLEAGDFTIDMNKKATPAKEVKPDTKNVVLATISLMSNGEDVTILSIDGKTGETFYIEQTNTKKEVLENVKLVESNGTSHDLEVATSTDTATGTEKYLLSLDEEIFLTKGKAKVFELKADINKEAKDDDKFEVTLKGAALEIEGEDSGATGSQIKVTPAGGVTSAVTTVKSASLTVNDVTLTKLSVVPGLKNQLVYQANVKAGSADDIKIQSFTVATSTTDGNIFNGDNIDSLVIYLADDKGGNKMKMGDTIKIDSGSVVFNSLKNNIVKAGKTSVVTIEASFSSSFLLPTPSTSNNFKLESKKVVARSVKGNDSIKDLDSLIGSGSREIVLEENGSLTVSIATDAKNVKDSLVLAGSELDSNNYLGEIEFDVENEDVVVEDLKLTLNTSLSSSTDLVAKSVESVRLYTKDGALVAEQTIEAGSGDVLFENINLKFTADEVTSLFISVKTRGINTGDAMATAKAGTKIVYSLVDVSDVKVSNSDTELTVNSGNTKITTVVGSKLNSVVNTMNDGKLTNGLNKVIAKYKFVFDNGNNKNVADNKDIKAYFSDNFNLTVSGDNTITLGDINVYIEGDKANSVAGTLASPGGQVAFASDALKAIEMDGEVVLVVEANAIGSATDKWLQTQLIFADSADVYSDTEGGMGYIVPSLVELGSVEGAYLEN